MYRETNPVFVLIQIFSNNQCNYFSKDHCNKIKALDPVVKDLISNKLYNT